MTKFTVILVAVLIIIGCVTGVYFYLALSNNSSLPSPSLSPTPSLPPLIRQEVYRPENYWNTISAQGFGSVDPLNAKKQGSVTFTISKGKTGIAIMGVEVIKAILPGQTYSSHTFNVSFSIEEPPDWVTVTFDPSSFIVGREQDSQVNMTITISPTAPKTSDKVSIYYKMAFNPIGTDIGTIKIGSVFYLMVTE